MKQMQDAAISKARWDGGYPKAVNMGLGVIALAKDDTELKILTDESIMALKLGVIIFVVLLAAVITMLLLT